MKRIILLIVLLLGRTCYGDAIAQWKMNDNASTADVVDSVGSNTGTFYDENTPATVTTDHDATGQINGGLEFDGTNDYITVSDNSIFSPVGTPFSIVAWVSLVGAESAVEFEILNKNETGKAEWAFFISADALYFNLWDATNGGNIGRKDTADYSAWEDAGFIFVVATYDGSNTSAGVNLYLNGDDCDDADEENGSYTALEDTASDLRMGYRDGSPNKASGIMDNIVVFDTELTQAQITTLYNDGNGTEGLSTSSTANARARYPDGYRTIYRPRYNY